MRIVSPYRPVPAVRSSQDGFDWIGALRMLRASAARSTGCEVVALTDVDTDLPVPAFQFATREARLMLWILEVSLAYLQSAHFDQDTVLLSPDTLVLGDLQRYFAGDLTIVVRPLPKYAARPVLNAAQWWPVHAKAKLIAFYQQALAIAATLSPTVIKWGADCEALRQLIAPIGLGLHRRAGLLVSMRDAATMLRCVNSAALVALEQQPTRFRFPAPIADFKYRSKRYMPPFFAALERASKRSERRA